MDACCICFIRFKCWVAVHPALQSVLLYYSKKKKAILSECFSNICIFFLISTQWNDVMTMMSAVRNDMEWFLSFFNSLLHMPCCTVLNKYMFCGVKWRADHIETVLLFMAVSTHTMGPICKLSMCLPDLNGFVPFSKSHIECACVECWVVVIVVGRDICHSKSIWYNVWATAGCQGWLSAAENWIVTYIL